MRRILLIAIAVSSLSCGTTVRELEGQAGAPSSPSPTQSVRASTATSNCDVLARVTPAPAPPLEIVDLGNLTKRLTSAEAGYSIVAPSSWFVSSSFFVSSGVPGVLNNSSSFGQAHLTSYDPTKIDRASQIASAGMLSPDLGIRLDIELWRNPTLETPEDYAKSVHIGPDQSAVLPGQAVTIAGQRAYQTTIQDEHRFQPTAGPLEVTRQTRLLWLVPVLRQDRMLVLYATPGESALRSLVESMVAKIQLSQPVVSQLPVINQRDAILRRWQYDEKTGAPIAGRRVEAKLTTYAESNPAMSGSLNLRIDRDPEELFWIVAVSGPDLPQPRGPMQYSPAPTSWMEYQTPATNAQFEGTATRLASNGTWPPDFDALLDRCH